MRIPKALAEQAGVEAGSEVDLAVEDGELIVRPRRRHYELGELLGAVTDDNVHAEIETGEPAGRESW